VQILQIFANVIATSSEENQKNVDRMNTPANYFRYFAAQTNTDQKNCHVVNGQNFLLTDFGIKH
jgi:hypothetical protein